MRDVEHREVLIVGAGPGGSSAARRLAEADKDVLVIERRNIVGNPAQCGECIPLMGEMAQTFSGIKDDAWLQDAFDVPSHITAQKLEWMRIFSPKMREYSFDLECITAHRVQFDGWLADRAVTAGAEVRTSVELRNVTTRGERDVYVTNEGKFTADHVIDASGALAHVARLRGTGQRPGDQLPTLYAQVAGDLPASFDLFVGSIAPGGYAWIIPKGEGVANIGLGMMTKHLREPLKKTLDRFIDDMGVRLLSYGGGWIPLAGPLRSAVTDNVLAVGDAAGLVMPSNGGGIGTAMVSGKYAADAIIANDLATYDNQLKRNLHGPLKISARTKKLFQSFCRGNISTELCMRILGTGGLRRAVDCSRPLFIL
jgi:digeranylgeranylglycerophospholipid reductase